MKKIIAALIAVFMLCACLTACVKVVDPETLATAEPTVEPTEEPTAEPTAEPTEEPTAEPTAEPTEKPTPEPTTDPSGKQIVDTEDLYFEVPAAWTKTEQQGMTSFMTIGTDSIEMLGYMLQPSNGVTLDLLDASLAMVGEDELKSMIAQSVEAQLGVTSIVTIESCKTERTTLNGFDTVLMKAELAALGINYTYNFYYFIRGDNMVVVVDMHSIDSDNAEAFEAALASLQIKP